MEADDEKTIAAPLLTSQEPSSCLSSSHNFVSFFRACTASIQANAIAILAGPGVALILLLLLKDIDINGKRPGAMIAVIAWVVIWWLSEAVPVAITGLVPLFLYPFLRIQTADEVARSYINDTSFQILGSFMLAAAIAHENLHKRLALKMLLLFGGKKMNARVVLFSFCAGSAFISMFVDNCATAAMLMPVAQGVLHKFMYQQDKFMEEKGKDKKLELDFCKGVVIGIAWSVTIGGMATLTGSGVNLVLAGMWQTSFPNSAPIEYIPWFIFAFPLALCLLLSTWILLCIWFCPPAVVKTMSASLRYSHVKEELESLGPIPFPEAILLLIFLVLIFLWTTRSISTSIPGWGQLFDNYPSNGTITVLMATLLFIIPNRRQAGEKLLDWSKCKDLHWDIILLIGGGFALANGMSASGLSDLISANLEMLNSTPYFLIAPIITIITSIVTEITQNVSTVTIFIPLLSHVALSIHRHPLLLFLPATIGSQLSFMLPIATCPNAIGYGTRCLTMRDMAWPGFILKLIGIAMLSVFMPTTGSIIFKTNTSFEP